jgi:hypothetical protein
MDKLTIWLAIGMTGFALAYLIAILLSSEIIGNLSVESKKFLNQSEELNLSLKSLNKSKIIMESDLNERISQLEVRNEELSQREAIDFSPTLNQVEKVLKDNKINEVVYDEETFSCIEYSYGLVKAFREEGIYSCTTWLILEEDAHLIVSLNTSDHGIVYIEPQTDYLLTGGLEIGTDYCEMVGWDCDWKVKNIKSCYSEIEY